MAKHQKEVDKAAALLGPDVRVIDIARGRGHWRMTNTVVICLAIFGAAALVALFFGQLLLPGALLIVITVQSARPFRWVAITDHGTALFICSSWNYSVKKVQTLVGPGGLHQVIKRSARTVTVQLGPEAITIPVKDYQRLVAHDRPLQPSYQ